MDLGDLGRAGDLSFEAALTGVCTLLLLGCLGWLLLATSAAVLGEVVRALAPGSALADRVARGLGRFAPRLVRGVVASTVGVALSATATAPSFADVSGPAPARPGLTGLALPDRTVGGVPLVGPARRVAAPDTVLVRPGDSLWSLMARRLPSRASHAEVASAVRGVFAANVARIGDDPDVIHPGTRLVLPPLHRKDRS